MSRGIVKLDLHSEAFWDGHSLSIHTTLGGVRLSKSAVLRLHAYVSETVVTDTEKQPDIINAKGTE